MTTEAVQYSKFRWFALAVMVVVIASTSYTMLSPVTFIGEIVRTLGVTPGEATAITMFTFNMVMAVFAILGGIFVDRVGVEVSWISGLLVILAGSLLMPFIGSTPAGLIVVRCLHAIGTGPIMASPATFAAQRFKYTERPYAVAFVGFAVCGGISLSLMAVPRVFAATGSWQKAITSTSVVLIVALVSTVVMLLGPKPHSPADSAPTSQSVLSPEFKRAVFSLTMVILGLMAFIDSWCQQAYNNMAPGFYAQNPPLGLGFGPVGAGAKLVWASYAMMLGTLAAPFLTDKVFNRNPKPTIFVGLLVAALLVTTVRRLTPDDGLLLILVPSGILFFSSFVNPTVFGYISTHYPSTIAGKLGGLVTGVSVYGAAVGLAISSSLLHSTGFYWASMYTLAAVTFAGAVVCLFLRPPEGSVSPRESAG
ncbi:MAG: MFS transporter [Deltaproteobacteria bacterium]|nr:MFS transporter [Deltaproteobacteria bacterium]